MSDEPPLTAEQLAAVLHVPLDMVHDWQRQGILPTADEDVGSGERYDRREVVRILRDYPQIMDEIKTAMRRRDATHEDEKEDK